MPAVAREQLVAAVSRESDGHVAPRQSGDEERRYLRSVRERLVVEGRQSWNYRERVVGCDSELCVVRPEMGRDRAGVVRFVEAAIGRSDRERLDGATALRLHERD